MPQMAPISWMILFFIFSISFILFNIMNYFCFFNLQKNNPSENNNNNNNFKMFNNTNKKMNLNWKW